MLLKNNKPSIIYQKGFTIVELLVVIVVIGILASITIVSYTGIVDKAKVSTIQSDLANASKKLELYRALYDSYPTLDNITKCPTAPVVDNNYCLKASGTNTYTTYIVDNISNPKTFLVESANGNIEYRTTSSTAPTSSWITIGSQTWAKYNLNVGTRVNGVTDQTSAVTAIEKYCYGDLESNCTTYGGLYQWDEAMQYVTTEGAQGICSTGSHIPSDAELKILELYLGMAPGSGAFQVDATSTRGTNQGTQLKVGGSSGLNVPLAGRNNGGSFVGLGSDGFLWSSSQSGANAWYRLLGSGNAFVSRDVFSWAGGWSVRCLKN